MELNGGTIQFTSPVADADLNVPAQAALPGHKVEARAPMLPESPPDGITVNGTTITLEYNEPLDAASVPVNSDFSAKKVPTGVAATDLTFSSTAPVISGNTVTLTLAASSSVSATDTDVELSYAPSGWPTGSRTQAGKHARPFTDRPVFNRARGQRRPGAGRQPAGAGRGRPDPHDHLQRGAEHELRARRRRLHRDGDPAGGIPTEVDLVGTRPAPAWASVNATTLMLEFSEALDTTSVPANSAFSGTKTVGTTVTGPGVQQHRPHHLGNTVPLTLAASSSVAATDTAVMLTYTKPTTNMIKDLTGKEAVTFPNAIDVVNVLADGGVAPALSPPVLAADGKTLTLTYNERLKTNSVPANSAFTVEATPDGGSEAEVALATLNGVSVSGSTVVLTLDRPIAHNEARSR